jgi:hypothetical protein
MSGSGTGTPATTTTAYAGAGSDAYACYARPAEVKSYLGITGTADDALLFQLCERARAKIDEHTHRHFWPKIATIKHDAYEESQAKLFFDDNLITLSTLTNGDGNAILAANYFLYPQDGPPYAWVELNASSGQVWLYQSTPQQAISIAGTWGWKETLISTGTTVNDATGLAVGATSITPASIAGFAVGDLLKIQSEYFYVTAVGASALTVIPTVNGSTAAAHARTTAISFVRFPDDIVRIATELAAFLYYEKDAPGGRSANTNMGSVTTDGLPQKTADDLEYWCRRMHV